MRLDQNELPLVGYSPEPWELSEDDLGWYICGHKGYEGDPNNFRIVASIDEGNEDQEGLANYRRIVAAVNACAGIPTEALESGAFKLVASE